MKIYKLIFVFLLFSAVDSCAQSNIEKHEISIEAGGIGGYGSLNYHHYFFHEKQWSISGRVGFSFFRWYDFTRKFNPDWLLPFGVEMKYEIKSWDFSVGVGQTFSSFVTIAPNFDGKTRQNRLSANGWLGLGYGRSNGRFSYHLFYSPIFQNYERYRSWGGLRINYLIKNLK